MKRMLCFFILMPLIIFSQEIPETNFLKISKGETYKFYGYTYNIAEKYEFYRNKKKFNVNNDFILIKQKTNPRSNTIIRLYDFYKKKLVWHKVDKKSYKNDNYFKIGKNIYKAYWTRKIKEMRLSFYIQKLNITDGSLSEPKKLFVIKDGTKQPTHFKNDFHDRAFTYLNRFSTTFDFLFNQSYDGNKFLIQYNKIKFYKNRREVTALCVFDGDNNTFWYKEYELPFLLKDIKNPNYQVDIYGNVYFFCTIDEKGLIIKFDENQMDIIVNNISMDNIVTPYLKDGPDGLMFLTGLSHIGGHVFEGRRVDPLFRNPEHINKIADAVFLTTFKENSGINDIKHFKISDTPLYSPSLKEKNKPYLFLNGIEVLENGDLVFVNSIFTKEFKANGDVVLYLIGEIILNTSKEGVLNWINTTEKGYLSLEPLIRTQNYLVLGTKNSCKIINPNTGEIIIEEIKGISLENLVVTPKGFAMEGFEKGKRAMIHFDF